jgi:hypothetical protein
LYWTENLEAEGRVTKLAFSFVTTGGEVVTGWLTIVGGRMADRTLRFPNASVVTIVVAAGMIVARVIVAPISDVELIAVGTTALAAPNCAAIVDVAVMLAGVIFLTNSGGRSLDRVR